ncbi:DUF72 domain-containing protein [Chryseosolibacter indicus]|uniref:DUF72 domain-containing protein n=1 Tax=Chryseosolibacter indicus TaxID=2782351 RepID=A0ABS5VQU5_9BACT|nr:DUF72 domain-containing protein [Chryseosolibacter indicus]MBT1702391.1 DUF72 domain-containing protein [Chryseosolibacter indicus]
MKKWWVGCSGFSYKHWKGKFYPDNVPQKKWFEYYCENFNTVELNVTFYRVPTLETFKSWYTRSPEDFRFTVKAPRLITHYKRFKNITSEVQNFYGLVREGLADKLGTVLFQLHPKFEYSEANLELLLKHMDPSYNNVIEFRHASWWSAHVYKELKKANVTFCSISYPGLPDDVLKTASVMYYRFHGIPQLYLSSYNEEELSSIISDIKRQRGVEEVYIYFNNDIDVHAIHNARTVQQLAGDNSVPKLLTSPIHHVH